MDTKKIMGIIVSIILLGVLAFTTSWTIINWDKVKSGMSGTELYTQEDLNNAYEDGYDTALTNEAEYIVLIDYYRDEVLNLNDTISQINENIADFQTQVSTLGATITSKNNTIAEKNIAIAALNLQITTLQTSVSNLTGQISTLTSSISNLTNDNAELNLAILNLQTVIANMQAHATTFNVTISQLNSIVSYLSGIIIDWENRTEFVVAYYVNGVAWDMQIISNPAITPTLPTEPTGNWDFIGWSLDGETVIDPTQISVITDIDFHAIISTTVTFTADGNIYDTQNVFYGEYASVIAPTKITHNFVGWSIDGITTVDLATTQITQDTTFTALWSIKTYSTSFVVDGSTIKTQTVNYGDNATAPQDPTKTDYVFMGWSVNGTVVDVESINITSNTTFVAVFELYVPSWHTTTYNYHYEPTSEVDHIAYVDVSSWGLKADVETVFVINMQRYGNATMGTYFENHTMENGVKETFGLTPNIHITMTLIDENTIEIDFDLYNFMGMKYYVLYLDIVSVSQFY